MADIWPESSYFQAFQDCLLKDIRPDNGDPRNIDDRRVRGSCVSTATERELQLSAQHAREVVSHWEESADQANIVSRGGIHILSEGIS